MLIDKSITKALCNEAEIEEARHMEKVVWKRKPPLPIYALTTLNDEKYFTVVKEYKGGTKLFKANPPYFINDKATLMLYKWTDATTAIIRLEKYDMNIKYAVGENHELENGPIVTAELFSTELSKTSSVPLKNFNTFYIECTPKAIDSIKVGFIKGWEGGRGDDTDKLKDGEYYAAFTKIMNYFGLPWS